MERRQQKQTLQRSERSIYIGPSFDGTTNFDPSRSRAARQVIEALVYGLRTEDDERAVLEKNKDLEYRVRGLMRRPDAPVAVESELERYIEERLNYD